MSGHKVITELAVGDVVLFRPATQYERENYGWSKYLGKKHVVTEICNSNMDFKIEDCVENYRWVLEYVSEVLTAVEFECSDVSVDMLFV